ncbi:MAG: RsmD family RNA methyltransferase [Candidatus Pelagibacter sp.]
MDWSVYQGGSKIVYFFENYIEAIRILEKNLSLFKNEKNFKLFKNDCFEFFNSNHKLNKKFDIVFLDPPYKETRINELIEKIIENKILNTDGVIIIHRHKKDKIEITNKIQIFDVRSYGLSKVYFAS